MAKVSVGPYILGPGGDNDAIIALKLQQLNAGACLVMHAPERAWNLAPYVDFLVYRHYWPDDNLHTVTNAAYWFQVVSAINLPEKAYLYCVNEPTSDLDGLVNFCVEAMDLADAAGRRLVVANFSVGNPSEMWWQTESGRLLLARLANSNHVLGMHEYYFRNVAGSVPHFINRYQNIFTACDLFDIPYPKLAITETGEMEGWQNYMVAEEFAQDISILSLAYYGESIPVMMFCYGAWANNPAFDVRPAWDALCEQTYSPLVLWEDEPEPEPEPEPDYPENPFPVGFHIGSANLTPDDHAYIRQYIRECRPAYFSLHGGMALAKELIDEANSVGHEDFFIVFRHDPLNQGEKTPEEIEKRGGVIGLCDWFNDQVAGYRDRIYFNPVNEPDGDDPETIEMMKQFIIAADERNVRLSLCGFGQAQSRHIFIQCEWEPGTNRWLNHKPLFDSNGLPLPGPWIDVLRLTQGKNHKWNWHIYWDFHNPNIEVPQGYNCPEAGGCNYKPYKPIDPDLDPQWLYNYGGYFVANVIALEQLVRMLGLTFGSVVSDEGGPDSLHSAYKGWRSAHDPSVNYPEYGVDLIYVCFDILRVDDGIYSGFNDIYDKTGINLFGYAVSIDQNDVFWGFDVRDNKELLTTIEEMAKEYNSVVEAGMLYECVSRVRIRTDHEISDGTDTNTFIEIGEQVEILQVYVDYTYRWGRHSRGWSAIQTLNNQYIWLQLVEEPEPPDPEPEPGEYVTVEAFEAYKTTVDEQLAGLAQDIADLQDQINNIEAPDWRKIAEAARLAKEASLQAAQAWEIIEKELSPEELDDETAALGEPTTPL